MTPAHITLTNTTATCTLCGTTRTSPFGPVLWRFVAAHMCGGAK